MLGSMSKNEEAAQRHISYLLQWQYSTSQSVFLFIYGNVFANYNGLQLADCWCTVSEASDLT